MFTKLKRIYTYYIQQHLVAHTDGPDLVDQAGSNCGHIDHIEIRGARVRVIGWTTAPRAELTCAQVGNAQVPNIRREDVEAALNITDLVGFILDVPLAADDITLCISAGDEMQPHPLTERVQALRRRAEGALRWRFARDLLRISPLVAGWLMTRSPTLRHRIKTTLLPQTRLQAAPMQTRLFERADDPAPDRLAPDKITIILPVYNAFDLLPEVLRRVRDNTDVAWRLIVIDDCSPDPRVRPFLRDWVKASDATAEIKLIENPENLGFIGSVNKGLALARVHGDHVLLLNSDAFVPRGWASRLFRPIIEHPNVATVTPMSNDAEIFSVPAICVRTPLLPGQGDAIDAVAATFAPEALLTPAPTGVGFCMAMNIDYLRTLAPLDTIFGKGYGEEVDWCQRARAIGGHNFALPGLFVEHRGGESFGNAQKMKLVLANNRIVSGRYPRYDAEVQDFLRADPLATARVALALAWAGSLNQGAIPIYLAHSLGGGAEMYLARRIARDIEQSGSAVVLRVGGPSRWRIEVHSKGGTAAGHTDDFAFVQALLKPLQARHVVYSCGVGDRDPVTLPHDLLKLYRAGQDRLEVLFHDFFPVSPSYCLLDHDGIYRGPVRAGDTDGAHEAHHPDGTTVTLADWQDAWGALINTADEVVVFSKDSATQVLAAYPGAAPKIVLRPHRALVSLPRLKPPRSDKHVVAVLGNIGLQKGARIVAALGDALAGNAHTQIVVIGNVDPEIPLPGSIRVHGSYKIADIPGLAARYGINGWLVPSIWPETFSFTTREALATGLPVLGFDLGAQGEVLRESANGIALAFSPDGDLVQTVINGLSEAESMVRAI